MMTVEAVMGAGDIETIDMIDTEIIEDIATDMIDTENETGIRIRDEEEERDHGQEHRLQYLK
jgi:hypothetical protein